MGTAPSSVLDFVDEGLRPLRQIGRIVEPLDDRSVVGLDDAKLESTSWQRECAIEPPLAGGGKQEVRRTAPRRRRARSRAGVDETGVAPAVRPAHHGGRPGHARGSEATSPASVWDVDPWPAGLHATKLHASTLLHVATRDCVAAAARLCQVLTYRPTIPVVRITIHNSPCFPDNPGRVIDD